VSEPLAISVCYLIREDEPLFGKSLQSVASFAKEIIVVDLGASAPMIDTALQHTTKISEFVWNKNFAAARNFAAELSNENWILMINPDEVFEPSSLDLLSNVTKQSDFQAFQITRRSYTNDVHTIGFCSKDSSAEASPRQAEYMRGYFDTLVPSLYQNGRDIVWENVIGESILKSVDRQKLRYSQLNIFLHRFAHLRKPEVIQRERLLQIELGLSRLKQNPDDPTAWYDYAQVLAQIGEYSRSEKAVRQALAACPDWPDAELLLARLCLIAERFQEAEFALRGLRFRSSSPAEVHGQLSTALLYQRKLSEALEMAQMAVQLDPDLFVANLNCGIILYEKGDPLRALDYFQKADRANPEDGFVKGAVSKIHEEVSFVHQDSAKRQNH